ncbi:TolC family protein [Rhodoferax sp. AJA081-3]|uniref:TolC family protein n=1 Tax=Rhodoferax sp. AJA081-3 TaxID=2752316 RepID=UPI001ADFBA1E|nr:TolC family protein [Rhodoferax sp. AJA081-3]QTN29404.1 TolC family protein [Rhodoferax sp. AJA081-3]
MFRNNQVIWWPCAVLALAATVSAAAEPVAGPSTATTTTATTLNQAFEAAWQRQPEALSQQARQDAAVAQQQAATRWTVEPVALELSTKTDRINQNLGRDETVAGISIPLWLPGERTRTLAVADAQARAAGSRVRAAQLRTAAQVREAYWAWARARADHGLAGDLLVHTQQLAQDVAKRVRAGDMARADQHQADGAVAGAQVALAEATAAVATAEQRLRALTGLVSQSPTPTATLVATPSAAVAGAEPERTGPEDAVPLDVDHPAVAELQLSVDVAQRTAELAQVQTRANPEITLATSRDRGQRDEAYQHSITLGIRIPLGSDSRNMAKRASAQADAIEAEAALRMERERLQGEVLAARVGLASAQTQLEAAQQRAHLAGESRAFFQKSYHMGETDLPTRLRIEREAADAERQAARAQIDRAAAQSHLRQTLGLLPE